MQLTQVQVRFVLNELCHIRIASSLHRVQEGVSAQCTVIFVSRICHFLHTGSPYCVVDDLW